MLADCAGQLQFAKPVEQVGQRFRQFPFNECGFGFDAPSARPLLDPAFVVLALRRSVVIDYATEDRVPADVVEESGEL